jgi:hypothetical protein
VSAAIAPTPLLPFARPAHAAAVDGATFRERLMGALRGWAGIEGRVAQAEATERLASPAERGA